METVAKQLENALAKIGELGAQVKSLTDSVAALTAERDTAVKALETEKATCAKAIAEANAATTVAQTELANEIAGHGATKKDLEKARHALANPAFADAGTRGQSKGTDEGGSSASDVPMTPAQANAEYKKIEDPVARARFRSEHAKELGL